MMPPAREPTPQSNPPLYRSSDADPSVLQGCRIAVVGYGNLGRSMALNLRDAGLDVIVGNVADVHAERARQEGFVVESISRAVAEATLSYLLVPDEVLVAMFDQEIRPVLKAGSAIAFGSGYFLAFGMDAPPAEVDVVMLAPRMLGEQVRRTTLSGEGYLSYCSVHTDATGDAMARLLALADAAGSLQKGAMELSAHQEALLDLLVEQTVGPYLGLAMQLAFQVGLDAGLPAEAMVLELYGSGEMSQTFAAFARDGFLRSVGAHGVVAAFGGFLRTLEIDAASIREHFARVAAEIEGGGFAAKLQEEMRTGYPTMKLIQAFSQGSDPMSQAEERLGKELGERF